MTDSRCAATTKVRLKIGENVDVKYDVLLKLQPRFLDILSSRLINNRIVLQIGTLRIFEKVELDDIIQNRNYTEQDQALALLRLIGCLKDRNEIICCLEKLCNLDNLPEKSTDFQHAISDLYPEFIKINGSFVDN